MSDGPKRFRVLSIDGGGMRGVYTAAYLSALTKRYAVTRGVDGLDIGKGLNLIAATSTGAIVGSALAVGLSLDRVTDLYQEFGPKIFPKKLPKKLGQDLAVQMVTRPGHLRAGAAALEQALHAELKDVTIGEVWRGRQIALAIPAVELSQHHAWVFKTPHLANSKHRDDGYRLVDICLATSAAPVFRSLAQIENPDTQGDHTFADGGLWANNPVLVGLIDALAMTENSDRIEIFCLGTCPRPEGEHVRPDTAHRGLSDWRFGGTALSLSIDAQEFAFDHMAHMLARYVDRDCHILRFPHGRVPADIMKYLDLDETDPDAMKALIAQANADVSETLSRCGDPADLQGQILDAFLREVPAAMGKETEY